jgi:feruloyl-CoA synthase
MQPVADQGAFIHPVMMAEIRTKLTTLAATSTGSATRIARALIMAEPPAMAQGEATAKGNINFSKLLSNRADLVARLYSNDPATITVEAQ